MEFITPKNDDCMKELFANEIVRKGFIGDVLGVPPEEIRSTHMANPFLWKRYRWQKQGILDVLLEWNDDTKINIELQVRMQDDWDKRNLFYLAKMFTDDLRVGEHYERLKKCICISLVDFNLSDRPEYHSVYRLRDKDGHDFSDVLEIHTIELKKELDDGAVAEWVRFFNVKNEEDLDMMNTRNEGILEAIREIKIINFGKGARYLYEERLKAKRDRYAEDKYLRRVSMEEGMEQQLIRQIERKLAKGQSVAQIAEALEETPERIEEVIGQMKEE